MAAPISLSSEEKLIGAAKQVAGSTAQLLLACKVKADPDSASMHRLEQASNAVRKATDNLVKAAQQALEREEDTSNVDLNASAVNSVVEVRLHLQLLFWIQFNLVAQFRKSMLEAKFFGWSANWSMPEVDSRNCISADIKPTPRRNSRGKRSLRFLSHFKFLGNGFLLLHALSL